MGRGIIKIVLLLAVLMLLTASSNQMPTDEYEFTVGKGGCILFRMFHIDRKE